MTKKRSSPKLALGIALILVGTILFLGRNNSEILVSSTFESEPVEVKGFGSSQGKYEEGDLPKRVLIPELSIDLAVNRAKVIRGYWEVFSNSAGWGEGSGIPGETGNQVIFAHAREGLFLPLQSIELNMKVYVLTEDKWYEYEVTEIKEVSPSQVEVIAPTEVETLTLYTCSGFFDNKRLIVVARR